MAEQGLTNPLDVDIRAAIGARSAQHLLLGGGIGVSPGQVSLEFDATLESGADARREVSGANKNVHHGCLRHTSVSRRPVDKRHRYTESGGSLRRVHSTRCRRTTMATKKARPEAAPSSNGQAAAIRPVETAPARTPSPRAAKGKATSRAVPAASPRTRGRGARGASADTGASETARSARSRPNGTGRRAAAHASKTAPVKAAPAAVVTEEDIRLRAYFLSLEQGHTGASELDCWIRAERELRGSSSRGE